MNTAATSFSSESWTSLNRRCSTETVFSYQGRETDVVRDTSDTDMESECGLEYEPATEAEEDGPLGGDSSENTDNEIISTKVIAVSVLDDGDIVLADSEQTDTDDADSEMDLHDYWRCAQCNADNNDPRYRYCEKCFKVRKNFFPPRPRRRNKRNTTIAPASVPRSLSQDSGVESAGASQDLAHDREIFELDHGSPLSIDTIPTSIGSPISDNNVYEDISSTRNFNQQNGHILSDIVILDRSNLKRRAESADRVAKRVKIDYSDTSSDSDDSVNIRVRKSKSADPEVKPLFKTTSDQSADPEVKPLVKTTSDPALTIETIDSLDRLSNKSIVNGVNGKFDDTNNLCIVCCAEPKSGVFVHGRIAHICCCYKCAVKVWSKAKRCPICNCRVSNVLKAVM